MACFSWTTCAIIFFNILVISSFPYGNQERENSGCRKCKPGYYVHRKCSDSHDTKCRRCRFGTFTSEKNLDMSCYPCSKCGVGLFELKKCTRSSDVFCESCASKEARNSKEFLEYCLGVDKDVAEMQADDSGKRAYGHKSENTDVKDDLLFGADSLKPLEDSKDATKEAHKKETNLLTPDLDLEEGSGYVLEEKSNLDPNLFTETVTLEPEEAEKEELIPVYTTKLPVEGTETSDVDTTVKGEDGSGLIIDSKPEVTDSQLEVTSVPEGAVATSPFLVSIGSSGDGEVVIVDGDGDGNMTFTTRKDIMLGHPSKRPPLGKRIGKKGHKIAVQPPEENRIGETKDESHVKKSGLDGKKRTAIIVGVAVGAVAFFTLGIFTTRYCKKHKAFKSMTKVNDEKKVKHQNGSAEALEFKDMRKSTGIFDETDLGRNGKYRKLPAEDNHLEKSARGDRNSDPVKKKPPRTNRGSTGDQDPHVDGIDIMKYMDETDEEVESTSPRDRLLRPAQLQDKPLETQQPEEPELSVEDAESPESDGRSSLSTDVMDKFNKKLAPIEEERAPMLPKNGVNEKETKS